jgi:hypothetical protein
MALNSDAINVSDRARRCILAGAIGDAMGGPFEGQPGPLQFREHTDWSISDDSQLTLATCESIIDTGMGHQKASQQGWFTGFVPDASQAWALAPSRPFVILIRELTGLWQVQRGKCRREMAQQCGLHLSHSFLIQEYLNTAKRFVMYAV